MFDADQVIIILLALLGAGGIGYTIYLYATGKLKVDIYDFILMNVDIINSIAEDVIKAKEVVREDYSTEEEYHDALAKIVAVRFRDTIEEHITNKLILALATETVLVELIKILFIDETDKVPCLVCKKENCEEHK